MPTRCCTRGEVMETDQILRATLNVKDAAKILGIGLQTAYELARRDELPGARRLGRRIVVSRKALEAFLEGRQSE